MGVLQDIEEKIIELKELSPNFAVDLFLSRARDIRDQEKWELMNYKTEDMVFV